MRRGQTLSVEQAGRGNSARYVSVSVSDPAGEDVSDADASCNSRKSLETAGAGDYRIAVFECRKADAWRGRFNLLVTVR